MGASAFVAQTFLEFWLFCTSRPPYMFGSFLLAVLFHALLQPAVLLPLVYARRTSNTKNRTFSFAFNNGTHNMGCKRFDPEWSEVVNLVLRDSTFNSPKPVADLQINNLKPYPHIGEATFTEHIAKKDRLTPYSNDKNSEAHHLHPII